MRILFVQKEGGIFGAENYHLSVIPELIKRGVSISFLRLYTNYQGGKGGEFVRRLGTFSVPVYEVNIGRLPNLANLKKIHRVIKSGNYDLVHTHLIHADFYVILAKILFRASYEVVSTKHGYDNKFVSKYGFDASKQRLTLYFLVSRFAEKRMKASYTISKGLRGFFIETGLTKPDKMSLIHYGFDLPDFFLQKGKGYRYSKYQIVIAGRLVKFKGHHFLLNALPLVITQIPDTKLLIIGSGKEEESLKQISEDLGIADHVEFLGYRNDVGSYMANSDVVIVPSVSEGFGVVFMEAFSAKTVVVAWDVPAANELIQDQRTGYLVPPYDIKLLAKRLIQAYHDPKEREEVANRAYIRLKFYFNLDRMVNETIQFYQKNVSLLNGSV